MCNTNKTDLVVEKLFAFKMSYYDTLSEANFIFYLCSFCVVFIIIILIFNLKTWCKRKNYRPERFGDDDRGCMVINSGVTNCELLVKYCELYKMEFEEIRKLLANELNNDGDFNNAWGTAESIFKGQEQKYEKKIKKNLSDLGQQSYSHLHYISLICYTMNNPNFYVTFNKKCRNTSVDTWCDFPYKSLWYLLSHIPIDTLSQVNNTKNTFVINYLTIIPRIGKFFYPKPFQAFRGVRFHYGDELQTNAVIILKQFTSASLRKEIALFFITESQAKKGTLIKFLFPPCASKSIKQYSLFPEEEEILVYPWSLFVVHEINRNGSIHNLVLKPDDRYADLPTVYENKEGITFVGSDHVQNLVFSPTNPNEVRVDSPGSNSFIVRSLNGPVIVRM